MNYYLYNGHIFIEQNLSRAGISTDDAQLLTDDEVETYLTDVAEGYQRVDGSLELEVIPSTTTETSETAWRNGEMSEFVDYYQSKPLLWAELSDADQTLITDYRTELKEYPDEDDFPTGTRPTRPTLSIS